jgi:hypothetical protein
MNLELWNKVKRPPAEALKTIQSGTLKGMTDINPVWRLEIMTEIYGPCGTGWGYTIDKLWTEPGNAGEVMCFALVTVWHGDKSSTIHGIGGSKIIQNYTSKNYSVSNDEGYKMAVTDAVSVALKALGVGADIYAGKWDGSKYKDDPPADKTPPDIPPVKTKGEIEKALSAIKNVKTKDELAKIESLLNQREWTDDEIVMIEATLVDIREAL